MLKYAMTNLTIIDLYMECEDGNDGFDEDNFIKLDGENDGSNDDES